LLLLLLLLLVEALVPAQIRANHLMLVEGQVSPNGFSG